jgi:UDP-N-acetylglucosamine:LPS N-acetylglucosamine transferase
MVNAADAVIGKAGYSTVAEVYNAGVPFGYVGRPDFRESTALTVFIEQEMRGLPIKRSQFQSGAWLSLLSDLLALPRVHRNNSSGADQVAAFVCELLVRRG